VRKTILTSLVAALVSAGAITVAAAGGDHARNVELAAANGKTQRAATVHYAVAVTMTKRKQPLRLHIAGASSRDSVAVHLRLDSLTLKDGTTLPGTTGAMLMSKPFLYESAPGGIAVFGSIRWLRLHVDQLSPRAEVLSTMRALTPSPLLRLVAESRLRRTSARGGFAGPVQYDDPVVRTALHALAGGIEFRSLRAFVHVARDGRIHSVRLTGRTADGKTTFALHASLFGFGAPVKVVPPKPGTFMDQQLAQLQA
jgi:hypothetical protein